MGCPRCGECSRWSPHDVRGRQLREYEGGRRVEQLRWRCLGCGKVITHYHPEVVPHFLYSRSVIKRGLKKREAGATWARAAAACTWDGQLEPSLLRRWQKRFRVEAEELLEIDPPAADTCDESSSAMLMQPAERRVPEPTQEDQWARGPPMQP